MQTPKNPKSEKWKKQNQIIKTNTSLRREISDIITQIDTFIIALQSSQINSSLGEPCDLHNDFTAYNQSKDGVITLQNILDDLPIEQQITLYQDSNKEIKSKLSQSNISKIESLENQIRTNGQKIYNIRKERESLEKINENYINAMQDSEYFSLRSQIEDLTQTIKTKKQEYKHKKNQLIQIEDQIKQQNNAWLIWEDNWKFIDENIGYKEVTSRVEVKMKTMKSMNWNIKST